MINIKKKKGDVWRKCQNCGSDNVYEITISRSSQDLIFALCDECLKELMEAIEKEKKKNEAK